MDIYSHDLTCHDCTPAGVSPNLFFMPCIDDIPLELWKEILDLACLDGGTTARSLSFVSHRINEISRGHLYYSIKTDTVDQLLNLEKQMSKRKENGGNLVTRSLCIILPKPFMEEVFAEGSYAPEDDSEDEDYDPSLSPGGTDSEDSFASDEISISASELEELYSDPDRELETYQTLSSLSDLANSTNAIEQFEYRAFGAIRRLLEACADKLEIFSLYFKPSRLIRHDILFPPLPRLRHLSIYLAGIKSYCSWSMSRDPSLENMYPSLLVLRMLGLVVSSRWWEAIISSRPSDITLKVVTQRVFYRNFDPTAISKFNCTWEFLHYRVHHEMLELAIKWWLEDANGGNGTSAGYIEPDCSDDDL